jgi:hypothetical protein
MFLWLADVLICHEAEALAHVEISALSEEDVRHA